MLRIISGKLRGRKLKTLKGKTARPTLEKTREAIFNILQNRYDLGRFEACDLFAGSGALGFEAFSRGVKKIIFTDIERSCVTLLKSNIQLLGLERDCSVTLTHALSWIKKTDWSASSKLFLLDPPYQSDLAQSTIDLLGQSSLIPTDHVIVLETEKNKEILYPEGFELVKQKQFGITRLDFVEVTRQTD